MAYGPTESERAFDYRLQMGKCLSNLLHLLCASFIVNVRSLCIFELDNVIGMEMVVESVFSLLKLAEVRIDEDKTIRKFNEIESRHTQFEPNGRLPIVSLGKDVLFALSPGVRLFDYSVSRKLTI